MLLTIHNLPSHMGYTSIRALILSMCGLEEVILDNLINEGNSMKVTVGVPEEEDAAILMRNINGLIIDGNQLHVEKVRQKKAKAPQHITYQNQQNTNQYKQPYCNWSQANHPWEIASSEDNHSSVKSQPNRQIQPLMTYQMQSDNPANLQSITNYPFVNQQLVNNDPRMKIMPLMMSSVMGMNATASGQMVQNNFMDTASQQQNRFYSQHMQYPDQEQAIDSDEERSQSGSQWDSSLAGEDTQRRSRRRRRRRPRDKSTERRHSPWSNENGNSSRYRSRSPIEDRRQRSPRRNYNQSQSEQRVQNRLDAINARLMKLSNNPLSLPSPWNHDRGDRDNTRRGDSAKAPRQQELRSGNRNQLQNRLSDSVAEVLSAVRQDWEQRQREKKEQSYDNNRWPSRNTDSPDRQSQEWNEDNTTYSHEETRRWASNRRSPDNDSQHWKSKNANTPEHQSQRWDSNNLDVSENQHWISRDTNRSNNQHWFSKYSDMSDNNHWICKDTNTSDDHRWISKDRNRSDNDNLISKDTNTIDKYHWCYQDTNKSNNDRWNSNDINTSENQRWISNDTNTSDNQRWVSKHTNTSDNDRRISKDTNKSENRRWNSNDLNTSDDYRWTSKDTNTTDNDCWISNNTNTTDNDRWISKDTNTTDNYRWISKDTNASDKQHWTSINASDNQSRCWISNSTNNDKNQRWVSNNSTSGIQIPPRDGNGTNFVVSLASQNIANINSKETPENKNKKQPLLPLPKRKLRSQNVDIGTAQKKELPFLGPRNKLLPIVKKDEMWRYNAADILGNEALSKVSNLKVDNDMKKSLRKAIFTRLELLLDGEIGTPIPVMIAKYRKMFPPATDRKFCMIVFKKTADLKNMINDMQKKLRADAEAKDQSAVKTGTDSPGTSDKASQDQTPTNETSGPKDIKVEKSENEEINSASGDPPKEPPKQTDKQTTSAAGGAKKPTANNSGSEQKFAVKTICPNLPPLVRPRPYQIPKKIQSDKWINKEVNRIGRLEQLADEDYYTPDMLLQYPLEEKILKEETDDICQIFVNTLLNPDNNDEMDRSVCSHILDNGGEDMIRRAVKLNASKRILDMRANLHLMLTIAGSMPPWRALTYPFMNFDIVCMRKMKGNKYKALCSSFDTYDKLCRKKMMKLRNKSKVLMEPYNFVGTKRRDKGNSSGNTVETKLHTDSSEDDEIDEENFLNRMIKKEIKALKVKSPKTKCKSSNKIKQEKKKLIKNDNKLETKDDSINIEKDVLKPIKEEKLDPVREETCSQISEEIFNTIKEISNQIKQEITNQIKEEKPDVEQDTVTANENQTNEK